MKMKMKMNWVLNGKHRHHPNHNMAFYVVKIPVLLGLYDRKNIDISPHVLYRVMWKVIIRTPSKGWLRRIVVQGVRGNI